MNIGFYFSLVSLYTSNVTRFRRGATNEHHFTPISFVISWENKNSKCFRFTLNVNAWSCECFFYSRFCFPCVNCTTVSSTWNRRTRMAKGRMSRSQWMQLVDIRVTTTCASSLINRWFFVRKMIPGIFFIHWKCDSVYIHLPWIQWAGGIGPKMSVMWMHRQRSDASNGHNIISIFKITIVILYCCWLAHNLCRIHSPLFWPPKLA